MSPRRQDNCNVHCQCDGCIPCSLPIRSIINDNTKPIKHEYDHIPYSRTVCHGGHSSLRRLLQNVILTPPRLLDFAYNLSKQLNVIQLSDCVVMPSPPLTESRVAAEGTCRSYDAREDNPYGYLPSIAPGVVFSLLFGFSMLWHAYQAYRTRTPWLWVLSVGGLGEVIGWVARSVATGCSYSVPLFQMQLATLIICKCSCSKTRRRDSNMYRTM